MKRKNILSALLSVTMLASTFTGLTASAEKTTSGQAPEGLPSNWVKVYGEDFEGYVKNPLSMAEGSIFEIENENGDIVNTDWKYWGKHENDFPTWETAQIGEYNGNKFIRRKTVGGRTTGMKLAGINTLPEENQVEFDLGSLANKKDGASNVFARINMSADGKSYYEIGHVGDTVSGTAPLATSEGTPIIVKHTNSEGVEKTYDYPVWYTKTTTTQDAEGNVTETVTEPTNEHYRFTLDTAVLQDSTATNDDGSTTTVTYNITGNGDYQGRTYFKMVKDGAPVFVKWGSGYSGTKGVFNNDWVHVTLKTTTDGVAFEMMPSDEYFGDAEKTAFLSGVCADTSLAGTGAAFMFGTGNHEGGVRLDNLAIYSEPLPDWKTWTADFSEDQPRITGSTGNIGDWTITDTTGTGWAEISNGALKTFNYTSQNITVRPNGFVAENLPVKNIIKTKLSQFGNYENNDNWYLHGSIGMKFAISEDGKSYYEIGKTGSSYGSMGLRLEQEGTDGVPSDTAPEGQNYMYRRYFRKVVDGVTTYIKWDTPLSTDWFARWNAGALTLKGYDKAGDITITNTENGVVWSYIENGQEFAGKLVDSAPLARAGAPIEFVKLSTQNQAYAVRDFSITYDANDLPVPPSFTDDFTSYTADNAVTQGNVWNLTDGEKVLATGTNSDGHKWQYVTSTKWTGSYASGISGDAYIDTSSKALLVRGRGGATYGSVKLDLGEDMMKSLEKVQAKVVSFDRMGMLNAFVNASETSFITFGLRADVGNPMGIGVANRLPVVALYTASGWQILAQAQQNADTSEWSYTCADGVTANIDAAWAKYNEWNGSYNTTWTIEVKSDNSVAFTAECDKGGKVTGTISADIVKPLLDAMRYPMSFMGAGDNRSTFTNVNVWYTKNEAVSQPQISDRFRDYTADNAVTTAYKLTEGKKVLATGTNDEGHKWQYVTSKVWQGSYAAGVSGDAYINITDKTLTFRGRGDTADGTVNFDLGNGAVKSVDKVNVKLTNGTRLSALTMFVSNDEKTYLTFGSKNDLYNALGGTLAVNNRYPAVGLTVNGKGTVLAQAQQDETTKEWSYTCADGVTAKLEKDFANTATPMDWTVTVNNDGSISYVAKGDNGGVMSGTISAEVVSSLMSNFRYPIAFRSGGDGWTKVNKVNLWYTKSEEYEEPLFYDDFELYKNDDDTITQEDTETGIKTIVDGVESEGTYTGHRMASGAAVLGTNAASGAKWITSSVWTGSYGDANTNTTAHNGQAYINTSAKALQVLGCNFPHIAAVNLDMGENKKFTDLHKVTFTMKKPARNAGVRLFVSGNEKYFLEFGFTGDEQSRYGMENGEVRAKRSPMIRKSVNPGIQADSRYWTADEMNAYKDTVIYDWSVFGTIGSANGVDNENTTIDTDVAWMGQDEAITYTITIREDGTVEWDAKGSAGGHSSGVINDDKVKELISANWVYPAAFASGGDGAGSQLSEIALYGATEDVSYDTMYEKKAYSQSEFSKMFKDADYGRDAQVRALLKLDLSDVISDEKAAVNVNVTAENDNTAKNVLTGTHYEFGDNYDKFYDADGNLRDEYKAWAKAQSPISTLRIGGGSSNAVNMWNDLNGLDSTYVSFPESKRYTTVTTKDDEGNETTQQVDKIGTTSAKLYKMGVAKTIQAFKANNPNMSFVLAVSPNTTTAEDTGKLVKALIGTDEESKAFRLEKFGSSTPINLYAIELGNEIDYGKGMSKYADLMGWYLDISNAMIDQIKANDPEGKVKIIACGPTAPWGTDSDWGSMTSAKKWVAQLADGTEDGQHKGIADRIDAMAFHAYYYGINPENVLEGYAKPLYDILANKGYGNVKLSMTEHAVFWHAENNYYATTTNSGLFAGLANAYFIVKAANGGFTDSGYNHSTVSTSGMYARWQYSGKDKKFHANPETTAYNVLTDAWSDNGIYKTTFDVTNDVTDAYQNAPTSRRFEATTVKVSDDTINLILINNQAYTQVDANITLPAEFKDFKLSKKVTYSAPNMYSFMFDTDTADLATVNAIEYENPEVFGDRVFTVPNKSMVILTLSGSASQLLKDEFKYSDTDAIEPEMDDNGNVAAKEIAANTNGTKWLTSTANIGSNNDYTLFGNAKISNGALVVSSIADAKAKMGANWNISGYKEVPAGINKITFTTTNSGATGGVMLFVKTTGTETEPVEESKFDFSNELCGFDGTVAWTVTIANGELKWSASSASSAVPATGTIAITDADMTGYDFLAQVYVNGSTTGTGSVALEKIDVSYGTGTPEIKDIISYTKGTDALNITIDPSAASSAISVWVGYYDGGKLVKVTSAGNYEAGAEAVDKPVDLPADGQTAKIFVWKTISGAEPVQGSITVK